MEIKLMYPQIIVYSLIAAVLMLFFWRKRKKYKKGVIVANSKYVKKTKYYKMLMARYRLVNIFIKVVCISLVLVTAVLTARLYKTDRHEETKFNRDIMLCMDVSGSVYDLDAEIIDTFIDIVSKLKDERFGISAFDTAPVNILPLTNDYDYAISVLKEIKQGFEDYRTYNPYTSFSNRYAAIRTLFAGTSIGRNGSSLIGDGLAYCASTFKKDDDRTKIIIFTTDNQLAGSPIISLSDAAGYCKENDVKVYPIGTKTILEKDRTGLVNAANTTNGKYYDFKSFSTDDIVKDIEELNKTEVISNVYITNQDLPELIFKYILIILPILIVLSWRVRI